MKVVVQRVHHCTLTSEDITSKIADGLLVTVGATELTEIGKIGFDMYGVFVCYGEKLSTGAAYGELDKIRGENALLKSSEKIADAISSKDLYLLAGAIENDFEAVNAAFDEVKKALDKAGCMRAFLCGSGPTVCGLYRNESDASAVALKLPYKCFVCKIGI